MTTRRWLIVGACVAALVVAAVGLAFVFREDAPQPSAAVPPNTVNVKDYGAKGNGKTDDGTAILRALGAAQGKAVYFPAGNYRVAQSFALPVGASVKGAGPDKQSYLMVVIPEASGTVSWQFTWIKP